MRSACEMHRAWIEAQVQVGRNEQSIFQDLVEQHGFTHGYNSVKRFVRTLKVREPERFDVLEYLPGEEVQVDFDQGALTLHVSGSATIPCTQKYRCPCLFVMTLKYSGKSFRKVVWKADQETWAGLHEEAFRSFGGAVCYVVLDNLKQGVLKPDLYEPQIKVWADAANVREGTSEDVLGTDHQRRVQRRRHSLTYRPALAGIATAGKRRPVLERLNGGIWARSRFWGAKWKSATAATALAVIGVYARTHTRVMRVGSGELALHALQSWVESA